MIKARLTKIVRWQRVKLRSGNKAAKSENFAVVSIGPPVRWSLTLRPGLHIDDLGGGQLALSLFCGEKYLLALAKGFAAVQQGLPELFCPERLCQAADGGDFISPQGHFPVGGNASLASPI